MNPIPIGYLHLADYLVENTSQLTSVINEEALLRSAINRYYYAINRYADHYLTNHIKDKNYIAIDDYDRSHKTIRTALNSLKGERTTEWRSLAENLKKLFFKRRDADYLIAIGNIEELVKVSKSQAWNAKRIIDGLISN